MKIATYLFVACATLCFMPFHIVLAATPFSAKCTNATVHSYELGYGLDNKKVISDKWSVETDTPISITFSYAGGNNILLEDSTLVKPEKLPILYEVGSNIMAVRVSKGSGGSRTTSYAINLAIPTIVTSSVESSDTFGRLVRASANNLVCTFNK